MKLKIFKTKFELICLQKSESNFVYLDISRPVLLLANHDKKDQRISSICKNYFVSLLMFLIFHFNLKKKPV